MSFLSMPPILFSTMTPRSYARLTTTVVGLTLLAGCSESGPKTVPVYGSVTFVGREAPPSVRIFFRPIKAEGILRPSVAERKPDGSYKANAFSTSKGLIPGTYSIQLTFSELKPGKDPKLETSWVASTYDAGEVVISADSSGVEHNIDVPLSIK